jgi:hypothetical protein
MTREIAMRQKYRRNNGKPHVNQTKKPNMLKKNTINGSNIKKGRLSKTVMVLLAYIQLHQDQPQHITYVAAVMVRTSRGMTRTKSAFLFMVVLKSISMERVFRTYGASI